ncbi:hypothetical protein BTN49_0194 [Candidatus Enterovibrio escicola]|uniref:Uncharacterized protein n=1 Tax=Candidatus Enterovibrio escicola TaxID=1927127 RepID=A0A2A5T7S6_9GAMM|nr:hypothetical protein BTN49_0194 [Candidatus Enterovibrio escacola]
MKLGKVMINVHSVYALLVIDLARSINRLHRIISYPYTRNHYSS